MPSSSYSRLGYGSLIVETTENTPIKPTNFFGYSGFDVVTKWGAKHSSQIFGTRDIFINPIKDAVDAPAGKLSIQIEPKMVGHFLKGCFGTPNTGRYFPYFIRLSTGAVTGTPVVGATLLQATSLATATVNALPTATSFDLRNVTVGFDATHLVTGTNPDGTTFTMTPSATLPAGTFTVGETITGGSSAKTATVLFVSNENDYLLVGSPSGAFTTNEIITGGTSSMKATIDVTDNSVYGHEFLGPQNTLPTYTVEIGYQNEAIRFMGVRFSEFSSVKQKDNIMIADLALFARSAFIYSRVTAVTASGSGTKVISCDQTQGLTTSDSVKIFRPRTASFIDLNGSGVKTNAITAIVAETSISMTILTTSVEVGDLIVLAPQTPSYSVSKEFSWIGGSIGALAATLTAAVAVAGVGMETTDFKMMNETESVHAANATTVAGRFPTANFIKAWKVTGKFKAFYQDMTFINYLRESSKAAMQITHIGSQIGATLMSYILDWRFSNAIATAFAPPIQEDNILSQEVPFEMYRSSGDGYTAKALLVTDTTTF